MEKKEEEKKNWHMDPISRFGDRWMADGCHTINFAYAKIEKIYYY